MSVPASASQATLVAPESSTLTLVPDSTNNTRVRDGTGHVRLVVSTPTTPGAQDALATEFRTGSGDLVARLVWREMLPDRLELAGQKPQAMTSWLKRGLLKNSVYAWKDALGRKYEWRVHWSELESELFAEDTPGGPIARFQRSRIDTSAPADSGARLDANIVMTSRAEEVEGLAVLSLLFIERQRRLKARVTNSLLRNTSYMGAAGAGM